MSSASQKIFAHVVDRPDEELELDVAALLIAEWEYEGLDVSRYTSRLDGFADAVLRSQRDDEPFAIIRALNRVLFQTLGFHGNNQDYYDPRNSFLHEVIDRRTGIPISLSVVYMEVARRLGVDVTGVGFPGHFLVRYDCDESALIIDPFRMGATLDIDDLKTLLSGVAGSDAELTPEMLAPTSKRQILFRMLANLAGIYGNRGDAARSIEILERMHILYPDNQNVTRELERLHQSPDDLN